MNSRSNAGVNLVATSVDSEGDRSIVGLSPDSSAPAASACTLSPAAAPGCGFHFYPQSLWFEQCCGREDTDELTPRNTYQLLPHERLVVGRYVPDPYLEDFSNPRYHPFAMKDSPRLRTRSEGPRREPEPPFLERSPAEKPARKWLSSEAEGDGGGGGFLPAIQLARPILAHPILANPAMNLALPIPPPVATVTATYTVVEPLYSFSAASLFFPVSYSRTSSRDRPDHRGLPQNINERFHPKDHTRLRLSTISIQKDNLNRMPLYKIGPGAVAFAVVINALEESGMKYTASNELFNLIWAKRATPYTLASMTPYQKVNHFPGTWGLGRKDSLGMNVNMMKRYYGEDVFNIIPPSFMIPKQQAELEKDAAQNGCASEDPPIYIVKPCASSCGRGITLHKGVPPMPPYPKEFVCQRYIGDPFLIGGRKFDLRLYCVVTSFDPLRIYLFDEGLVRFAAMKYPGPDKELDNINMHLTNYSINKTAELKRQTGEKGLESEDAVEIKWCISELRDYIKSNHHYKAAAWEIIQRGCDDAVVKAFLSVEGGVIERVRQTCSEKTGRNCFELFGLDLLVDSSLKVWLIEANTMPSLATGSNLDKAVKSRMLAHMLTLIRVIPNRRNALNNGSSRNSGGDNSSEDFVPLGAAPTTPERVYKFGYHPRATSLIKDVPLLKRFNDPSKQESMLSKEEVLMLVEAEEEMHCAGGFRCVFPAGNTLDSYLPLFTHGVRRNTFLLASAVKQKMRNPGGRFNLYI